MHTTDLGGRSIIVAPPSEGSEDGRLVKGAQTVKVELRQRPSALLPPRSRRSQVAEDWQAVFVESGVEKHVACDLVMVRVVA